jgi:hypothetical protein
MTTESNTGSLSLRATVLLAMAGQTLVILGSFGWINAWTALVVVLATAIAMRRIVWRWWYLAFLPMIALASYPPIAFDETLYHLPYIDSIARSGAIVLRPDIRFEIFPLLHELLALPAYWIGGATATHFVSLLQLMILTALVLAWPKRRHAGWLAAAIVAGNPPLLYVSAVAYVDVALTLFVAAAFFCLERDDERAVFLAGFLLGTAAAVKYMGFFFIAAGLLFVRRHSLRYIFGAALGVLPMTLRIFALTGNPLHPYFSGSDWANLGARDQSMLERAERLLRLPYDITFAREHVNFQPPYTPLFVVALIIAVFFARKWRLGAICLTYFFAFVALFPADSRYLLPLVPLVAVPAADFLAARFDVRKLASVAALPLVLYPVSLMVRIGPPPLTAEGRHAFLRGHWRGLAALDHAGQGKVFVCGAEELKYFGGDRVVGDHRGRYGFQTIFARGLEHLDANWILVDKRNCNAAWREQVAAHGERVYEDAESELWKMNRGR